ncbi:hypothetical protein DUNSADRAFT_3760 [Dunaliella salina]|uniref:PDEase domain-containing protein n=1 Tax=Dunaliella salina TaxID=3046 RepID=A0ABQ7GTD1_DUNSA|nr:hypothetical protein DUNSADRAFT_3760 [Dunaliella salina]|eukprot:KAF5837867.1 hypothetical protein DUNSADRAFT_3760 [Dunaliella salina]
MHEGDGGNLEHKGELEQTPAREQHTPAIPATPTREQHAPAREQQRSSIRFRGHIETCFSPRKASGKPVASMQGPHQTAGRHLQEEVLLYEPAFTQPDGSSTPLPTAKAPAFHWEQPRTARSLQASLDAAQEAPFKPGSTFSPLTPAPPRFAPSMPSLSTPAPGVSAQHSRQQAATPAAVQEPPLLSGAAHLPSFHLRQLLQEQQEEQQQHQQQQQQPPKMNLDPLSQANVDPRNGGTAAALIPDMQLLNTVWHLPVFEFSLHRLSNLAAQMLVTGQQFLAQAPLLEAFANTVILEAHAPQLPRHDARHAVLQLHFCWRVMRATGAHQYMDPMQQLALCLAALCSHINHPGLSATALEEMEHPMAVRYAALAAAGGTQRHFAAGAPTILQCHHCAVAVAFLGSPAHDVLHSMSRPEARTLQEAVCTIICSTDARQHFHLLAASAHAVPPNHQGLQSLQSSPTFSLSFCCQLARCAQLVRFFLPWDTAKHLQGLEEKEDRMQMLTWMVGDAAAASLRPLFESLHRNRAVLQALLQDSEAR